MTEMHLADPSNLRNAFAQFPSGVAALAATIDGISTGLVASSFTVGVSQDPPLVMFAIQNTSSTWPILRTSPRIGVSILANDHSTVCRQLASKSGDRFAGLPLEHGEGGSILITGSALSMNCEIVSETPAGDHAIVVLKVHEIGFSTDVEPLIFHGSMFRQLAVAS